MTEPISEQIAQALKTTLEGVTEAAGYSVTIAQVVRPTRTNQDLRGGHLTAMLLQDDPERADSDALGFTEWLQVFGAVVCLSPSEDDDTPIETYANRVIADVQKAWLADGTVGGLAIAMEPMAPETYIAADGSAVFVAVRVQVHYRHLELDPYSQGG
jgi:hypothetical protein